MTLPNERVNAIKNAREFLRDLMDSSKTKRIPLEIRRNARWVLKHFPTEFDMERIFDEGGFEDVFGTKDKKSK